MKRAALGLLIVLCCQVTTGAASVRSMHRELRRMVGYTILSTDTVKEVSERSGTKYVQLSSGITFKADAFVLLLDPLPLSDVVIFSKPMPPATKQQMPNLPEPLYYFYKLLINDEVIEVTPVL